MMKLCTGKLAKRVSDFLKRIGIQGALELQQDESGDYIFNVGENQFTGFYPDDNHSHFNLRLIETQKKLQDGVYVEYVESFVFTTRGFTPIQFVIHQYPQAQITYLLDLGKHHKGDVEYINTCPYGGTSRGIKLAEPMFTSDLVDLSDFLD